jgi:ribonuclease HI
MYRAWTDGAARRDADGVWHCGYAVVLLRPDGSQMEVAFHECGATSQGAELLAVIEAVEMVSSGERLHVDTDSQYVVSGILGEWNLSNKNRGLWDRLRRLSTQRDVEYTHIPRCSEPEAVVADKMAKEAMRRCDDAR